MKLGQLAFGRTAVLGGLVAGAFLVCCLSGCGEGGTAATLSGTVKFSGEPVPDGTIRLLPDEGVPGDGASSKITEGKYSLSGDTLKAGSHQVVIMAFRGTGQMVEDEGAEPEGVGGEEGEEIVDTGAPVMIEEKEQYIPDKYNRASAEKIDLTPGANSKDFDLQP